MLSASVPQVPPVAIAVVNIVGQNLDSRIPFSPPSDGSDKSAELQVSDDKARTLHGCWQEGAGSVVINCASAHAPCVRGVFKFSHSRLDVI